MTADDRTGGADDTQTLSAVVRRLADREEDAATGEPRAGTRLAFPLGWGARALLILALVRIAGGFFAIVTGTVPSSTGTVGPSFALVQLLAFGGAGLLLLVAHAGDSRTARLGAVLLIVASAFTPFPFLQLTQGLPLLAALAPLYPDAFLPYFLGYFMLEFPRRRGERRADRLLFALVRISLAAGFVLFLANGILGWSELEGIRGLEWAARARATGTAYWTISFGLIALMLPLSFTGTNRLDVDERRRVRFFWTGFVVGLGPLVLAVVLGVIPAVGVWMVSAGTEAWLFPVVELLLASVAVTVAYAVGVRRMLPLRVVVRKAAGYVLARASVTAAFVLPVAALAVHAYRHRDQTIATVLSGEGAWLVWAAAVTGGALVGRERLLRAIDRRFFRESRDARDVLMDLAESSRRAQTLDELVARFTSGIDRAFRPDHLAILVRDQAAVTYVSLFGSVEPLPTSWVLVELLGAATQPVESKPGDAQSPLRLLPRAERQWLVDSGSKLLVPMRGPGGDLLGVITLAERRSELPYAKEDRRLLMAIADAAALTIAHHTWSDGAGARDGSMRWRASLNPQHARAAECTACGKVFQGGTAECRACGTALTPAEVPLVLFGKFRFEARIGRGGMGVVYRAVDLALDRSVAVKTLPDASPEQSQRLRNEAKAMAAVTHPNLAAIHGAESWHGKPFLICELMPHGTLADRLARGRVPIKEALDLGIALAEALTVVHGVGLLHRDIKPSNIGYADRQVPKLLDFGLVHILTSADPGRAPTLAGLPSGAMLTSLSIDGALIGTPLYLSPEAVRGASPSTAFDLWSLHVLLLEAITGRHPFRAQRPEDSLARVRAADIAQVLDEVRAQARDVAAYFEQALAKSEKVRPQRAADVVSYLRDLAGRRVAIT